MGFTPQFTVRIESRNGVVSIALSGELDIATVPVLEDGLARFEGDGVAAIMLDLRELTFLDCSALRAFLAARDRAKTNGHRLILLGASSLARRLFELAGAEFLLDEQEAVSVFDPFTGSNGDRAAQAVSVLVDADV